MSPHRTSDRPARDTPAAPDEPVTIVDYDPRWPDWFGHDATEVLEALDPRVIGIEHVGSTAVADLAARPVIDILVGLRTWPLDGEGRRWLQTLGYVSFGEAGVPGREYFRRRSSHATDLVVVEWGGPQWLDNIVFRDYLRANSAAAYVYGKAKRVVWAQGARTLLAYSEAKSAAMMALLETARDWRINPAGHKCK